MAYRHLLHSVSGAALRVAAFDPANPSQQTPTPYPLADMAAAAGVGVASTTNTTAPSGVAASTVLFDLEKPGLDNSAMMNYWQSVDSILGGIEAMLANKAKTLPKWQHENDNDYKFRCGCAKLTNVLNDIIEDLAQRPFSTEIKIDKAPTQIVDFCKDVDGANNDITQFAGDMFYTAIAYVVDWVFIDFPPLDPTTQNRTRADDLRTGRKPFWSHIRAQNVLEVRSDVGLNGNEQLTYMRVCEPATDSDPLQIRIMEWIDGAAYWSIWHQIKQATDVANGQTKWARFDFGVFTIGLIPVVPFYTGRRQGRNWRFMKPMQAAVELQTTLFQNESDLEHTARLAAFPMISANGVKPETIGTGPDKIVKAVGTGPGVVLFGGTNGGVAGTFQLLEPAATSMTFLSMKIKATKDDLRELGRQPLTAQSGNLTVITTAVAAMKGNSAVKAWAVLLGRALEAALQITGKWMNADATGVQVDVFKDFDVDGQDDDQTTLLETRKNGDISQRTYWKELVRRNVLSPDFNPDDEEKQILAETPDDTLGGADTLPGDILPKNVIPINPTAKPPVSAA